MRVLITGGAGFIGGHLAHGYVRRGDEVVVLDDLSGGSAAAVPAGATLVRGDVADPSSVALVADARPDLVVHAAAQVSVARSVDDPEADRMVNVGGTANVVDAAQRARSRIVFLSSGGAIYGDTSEAGEDDRPSPQSPYGRHKLEAERLVESSGLGYAIARLANVYGPGQRSDLEGGVVAIFATSLSEGRPVTIHGDGSQVRDFIHVADVARALELLGDSEREGTWNVGTGQATSVRDLLAHLEDAIRPASKVRVTSRRPGDVAASCLRIDRIRRDFGWTPRIDLVSGLRSISPADQDALSRQFAADPS